MSQNPANTNNILILLPHHLYDFDTIVSGIIRQNHIKKVIMIEHPQYFTKYNFNKKKLILHRASMKYYFDKELISGNGEMEFKKEYIDFDKYDSWNANAETKKGKIFIFDATDKFADPKIFVSGKTEILESPNFLLSRANLEDYRKKTDKFFFTGFYMWAKKVNDIIPNVKSKDRENREKVPAGYQDPKLPAMSINDEEYKNYVSAAAKYVEDKFADNCGNSHPDQFIYPIDRKSALKWFHNFVQERLKLFGPYEDYTIQGTQWLNHSVLSSSINIGLINPTEIIDYLRPDTIRSQIPLNSYEGYIRQLYWREYQRLCYWYIGEELKTSNYFGLDNKLGNEWYSGETGCPPVDDAIRDAFNTGYLHHIRRLMIMGNYMVLNEIDPHEGFKWFMEFSIDSYEWVMYQNVYDMVFCSTGGKTMRKPYISSSTYILNMSDYKSGEWSEKWSDLFRKFLKKHKSKMMKFVYSFPMLTRL